MVVFTCGHCGESVQKPKVEKHYLTKCRNLSPNLSCMDCFKDFLGKDYEAHIKCITEEQRYSGKGFVAKEKKGEKKQNVWVEMLQSVLDEQNNAPKNVLKIIETISKHNNTPRKKPKFINFVKNVCGQKTNIKDIDQAWELISVKLSALSNAQSKNQSKHSDLLVTNGDKDPLSQDDVEETNDEKQVTNGVENGITENGQQENKIIENGEKVNSDDKKLSKKQRKEEKKRQKYEAELQSAGIVPTEEETEETQAPKKDKKKKNKHESVSNADIVHEDGKGKNKKRKRQDTVTVIQDLNESNENIENEPINKEKAQKKKLKVDGEEELDESACLHDQNVAKSEEAITKTDKFNWHAVIISVLEKKGNEVPFKRLQKKVLAEYGETTGRDVDDRIVDKFIKKLKSAPHVRVDKNRVYIEQ